MNRLAIILGLAVSFATSSLLACDIVEKRTFHSGFRKGVRGVCSNNNRQIQCFYSGKYQGGLTCDGPLGTNSGYNLQDLIDAVCGCSPEDEADNPQYQLEQEIE